MAIWWRTARATVVTSGLDDTGFCALALDSYRAIDRNSVVAGDHRSREVHPGCEDDILAPDPSVPYRGCGNTECRPDALRETVHSAAIWDLRLSDALHQSVSARRRRKAGHFQR